MWLPISQLWRFPPGSGAAIISAARLARMRASPLPRILRHATDAPLRRPVKWIPQTANTAQHRCLDHSPRPFGQPRIP